MSSGFVAGSNVDDARDEAWKKVQADLEERKKLKEHEGQQEGGKSLYEVLQANKAAKQEAFEETTRLKNQYRALDDDEAEFLDSVLESTRKQEAAVKKDTLEQLEAFRKHQEEAERKALTEQNEGSPQADDAQWATGGRKRKKGNEKDGALLKGVKLRKASSSVATGADAKDATAQEKAQKDYVSLTFTTKQGGDLTTTAKKGSDSSTNTAQATTTTKAASLAAHSSNALSLGLGYASSDDDD